ncbi:MAG: hypothetical protein Harvfovirus5_52 [Harvfovirus sp.]|uniref:MORN repeat-containing protein n=1 Tax=Harvfovirus sp. TaxID=2487768 RepID=A0A3G5A0N0_9VIRU|nr:MAG: hypothetical protein Harvfovirus5_52 [Harvfovirus sp.]
MSEPHGLCEKFDRNHRLVESCQYVLGQKHGLEKIYSSGVLQSQKEYRNGKLDGLTVLYPEGHENDRTEIIYVNGIVHGDVKRYEFGRLVELVEMNHGKKNGIRRLTTAAGYGFRGYEIMQTYKDDLLDGDFEKYGISNSRDERKVLLEKGSCKRGLRDGIYNLYNNEGVLVSSVLYREGKLSKVVLLKGVYGCNFTFQEGEIIVYKACVSEMKFVFVEIKVPADAGRVTVFSKWESIISSHGRIERGTVMRIEDQFGKLYDRAHSFVLRDDEKKKGEYSVLEYKLGEEIKALNYDDDPLKSDVGGIHVHLFPEECLLWEDTLYKILEPKPIVAAPIVPVVVAKEISPPVKPIRRRSGCLIS